MPELDEPPRPPMTSPSQVLRGEPEALAEVERLAARGNRVAALVSGYWHQRHDQAKALAYLSQAADGGNPVAEQVVARSAALETLNGRIARLPRLVEPVVQPLIVGAFIALVALVLVWVWWGADTPRFLYDDALQALNKGDLHAAKLGLSQIARTYPRSRWSPRAKGGALVLQGWEDWEAGNFEAAGANVDEAGKYPLADFNDRYQQLKRTVAAEREAASLYNAGMQAEKLHDFDQARALYGRILSQYDYCHCAGEARKRQEAVNQADQLYRQARAALAADRPGRCIELCRRIEQLGVGSYKVCATVAEAYESQDPHRWSLAALWWQKADGIHHTDDLYRRWLRAAEKARRQDVDPVKIEVSGTFVGPDRARFSIRYTNLGEFPLWGIRLVLVNGSDAIIYNQVLVPDKDNALEPGETRSLTTYADMLGSSSFKSSWSDWHKLKRR